MDKSPETTSSTIIILIWCQQSRSSADKHDQKISEEINDSIERIIRKTGSKNLSCLLSNLQNNKKYRHQANNQTFIEKRESSLCDTSIWKHFVSILRKGLRVVAIEFSTSSSFGEYWASYVTRDWEHAWWWTSRKGSKRSSCDASIWKHFVSISPRSYAQYCHAAWRDSWLSRNASWQFTSILTHPHPRHQR